MVLKPWAKSVEELSRAGGVERRGGADSVSKFTGAADTSTQDHALTSYGVSERRRVLHESLRVALDDCEMADELVGLWVGGLCGWVESGMKSAAMISRGLNQADKIDSPSKTQSHSLLPIPTVDYGIIDEVDTRQLDQFRVRHLRRATEEGYWRLCTSNDDSLLLVTMCGERAANFMKPFIVCVVPDEDVGRVR